MKIKLIKPPAAKYKISRNEPPYGLSIIKAYLKNRGVTADIVDVDSLMRSHKADEKARFYFRKILEFYEHHKNFNYYDGLKDKDSNSLADKLMELVEVENYNVVGIGISSYYQILPAFLIAEKIKKEYNIPIIFGGSFVTLYIDKFFSKYNFIDYAIVGDGENPLFMLLNCIKGLEKVEKIPSLWWKNGEDVVCNRREFFNIEEQFCPDYEGLDMESYRQESYSKSTIPLPYGTSVGCNYRCTFCTHCIVNGIYQEKSIEKILKDISYLKEKNNSDHFSFSDSTFNMNYGHVDKLCDRLIESKVDIKWFLRVAVKGMDENLLCKMRKAGCYEIKWGFESGSRKILKAMGKPFMEGQADLLKKAQQIGIHNVIYLMFGYPYETIEDLIETKRFVKKYSPYIDNLHIFELEVTGGSHLHKYPEKYGIKIIKRKDTFFTNAYDFKETKSDYSYRDKKRLIKFKQKTINYTYNKIMLKHYPFMYHILIRIFGKDNIGFVCDKLMKPIMHFLRLGKL